MTKILSTNRYSISLKNIFFNKLTPILFLLFSASVGLAQHEMSCGTELTEQQKELLKAFKPNYSDDYLSRDGEDPIKIGLSIHIGRTSDGYGGLSESNLNIALEIVNNYFEPTGLSFFILNDINYIDYDKYYYFNTQDEYELADENERENTINIYFFESIQSGESYICGRAYYPGGPNRIFMNNSCAMNGSTFSHELGHFFFLLHTHGGSNSTLTTELVDGSNCDTDGDFVCDTPADPKLSYNNVTDDCEYIGFEQDINGDYFEPDPSNIMSYSKKHCRTLFTTQQLQRMEETYYQYRTYLKTYKPIDLELVSVRNMDVVEGNSNNRIEPGETINMNLELLNLSPIHINNATITISASDSDIEILNNTVTVSKLYDSPNWINDFEYSVSENATEKEVTFNISVLSDEGEWNFTDKVNIVLPYYINVSPLLQNVGAEEGEAFFNWNSNHENLDFSVNADWLNTSIENDKLMIYFQRNPTIEDRSAQITIKGEGINDYVLTVNQAFDNLVSIEETFKSDFNKIFPNPTKEYLFLKLNHHYIGKDITIQLYDFTGKRKSIFYKKVSEDNIRLSLKEFNSGLYVVSVSDLSGNLILKDKIVVDK